MKLLARILIKLRNFVWEIRRHYDEDAFEIARTDDYCKEFLVPKTSDTFEEDLYNLFHKIESTILEYKGKPVAPERDCILQYEEKDQLCSFHYYLDEKYQIHIRFFKGGFDRFLSVYAHKEIRPDFNPLAHIQGKEMENGCPYWDSACHYIFK